MNLLMHIPHFRNKARAKQELQRRAQIKKVNNIGKFAKLLGRFEKRCATRKTILAADAKRYRKMTHIMELSGAKKRRACIGAIFDFSQDVPRQELPAKFSGKFRIVYNDSEFFEPRKKPIVND